MPTTTDERALRLRESLIGAFGPDNAVSMLLLLHWPVADQLDRELGRSWRRRTDGTELMIVEDEHLEALFHAVSDVLGHEAAVDLVDIAGWRFAGALDRRLGPTWRTTTTA